MATYVPLASTAQFQATFYNDLCKNMTPTDIDQLMIRASRSVEALCQRRLAPFTGLQENHRATGIDVEDATDYMVPMDPTAQLGISRAQSLGATGLVRHVWVRQFPPLYEEMWVGAITAVNIIRSFSGSQTVDPSTITYEPDLGHVRFRLGTFIPPGSTIQITYSGGYGTVATPTIPDDLVEACIIKAALLQFGRLNPETRPELDTAHMDKLLEEQTEAYWRS